MIPGTIALPIGLLIAGWAAEKHVHWIVTDIVCRLSLICLRSLLLTAAQGIALLGAGLVLVFQSIQTYVVDTFTLHAASGESPFYCMELARGL